MASVSRPKSVIAAPPMPSAQDYSQCACLANWDPDISTEPVPQAMLEVLTFPCRAPFDVHGVASQFVAEQENRCVAWQRVAERGLILTSGRPCAGRQTIARSPQGLYLSGQPSGKSSPD